LKEKEQKNFKFCACGEIFSLPSRGYQAGFCEGKTAACLPRNDRSQKQQKPKDSSFLTHFFSKKWGFPGEKQLNPPFLERKGAKELQILCMW